MGKKPVGKVIPFTVIDHTADTGIHAQGYSLSTLFNNAAMGMLSIITSGIGQNKLRRQYEIHLVHTDIEELLIAFLKEILYQVECEGMLAQDMVVFIKHTNTGYDLASLVYAIGVSKKGIELSKEIKAVTYCNLKVWQEQEIWNAKVIFDV